jgi:hypothetical protein
MMHRLAARAVVLAWMLAVAGTAGAQDGAALAAAVRDLVGTAACTDDAQCRTLPYGAKACGGPQSWLAWSTLVSDEAALRKAAERFASWRREDLRASGTVSDCLLVADPGAYCAPASSTATGPTRACTLRSPKQGRGSVAQ